MTEYRVSQEQNDAIRQRVADTVRRYGIDPSHVWESDWSLHASNSRYDVGTYLEVTVRIPLTWAEAAAIVNGPT